MSETFKDYLKKAGIVIIDGDICVLTRRLSKNSQRDDGLWESQISIDDLEDIWDHQQNKIDKLQEENKKLKDEEISQTTREVYKENIELKARLKEAESVIDFYGDEGNWDGYGNNQFIDSDAEDYVQEYINMSGEPEQELLGNVGGKRAREYKQKYKDKE